MSEEKKYNIWGEEVEDADVEVELSSNEASGAATRTPADAASPAAYDTETADAASPAAYDTETADAASPADAFAGGPAPVLEENPYAGVVTEENRQDRPDASAPNVNAVPYAVPNQQTTDNFYHFSSGPSAPPKDPEGRPTEDSELADELYQQLTEEDYSVCLPRITFRKYSDSEKQRYISAALDSAEVMIVIGTKPAYFEASPVKKQWTNFLSLAEKSISQKTLIPAYRGMSRDELPEEFSDLKAGNMSKMSFLQDILRAVKGSLQKSDSGKAKTKKSENITVDQKTRPASGAEELLRPMLKRVHMCLEDGNWEKADAICEQALNMDPENAQAYLGKLMAELHVHKWEELKNCRSPFDGSDNYRKAVRFGDEKLSDELKK